MRCEEAARLLAELGTAEIGAESGELGRHLRACEGCRELAGRIVAHEADLASLLERLRPEVDVEIALERAEREAHRRSRRRVRSWRWGGAAAAAAAALLLAGLWPGKERGPAPQPPVARPAEAFVVELRQAAADNVIVFHTEDPDIVVLWFY